MTLRRADIGFIMPRVEANSRLDVNQLGIASLQEVKFRAHWLTSAMKTARRAAFRAANAPNPMCFYRLASALKLYLGVNWKAAWYL